MSKTNMSKTNMSKTNMSKTNNSLSDLLDEQCSSIDLDSLLKDSETSDSWHRYSAVSVILKSEYSANASTDFCKEISAKIADEPAILAAPRPHVAKSSPATAGPVTADITRIGSGFAIAASVAFATFFSVQTLQVSSELSPLNENSAKVVSSPTSESIAATQATMPSNKDSLEQLELESFNEALMLPARQSEIDSIAPFATSVGGEYVKTIRISAEQWQGVLQRAALRQSKLEAAKAKLEADNIDTDNVDTDNVDTGQLDAGDGQ